MHIFDWGREMFNPASVKGKDVHLDYYTKFVESGTTKMTTGASAGSASAPVFRFFSLSFVF